MRVELGGKPLITRAVLEKLGDARLQDAEVLCERARYAASIYLGGYAVECWLKVAICSRLSWSELYETFKSHDLFALFLHTGLKPEIAGDPNVEQSFKNIVGVWKMDASESIRYNDPDSSTETAAREFLEWVRNDNTGVVPWVKRQI